MGANGVGQPADIVDLDGGEDLVGIQVLAQLDVLLELLAQTRGKRVIAGKALVAEWGQPEIRLPISIFFRQLQNTSPLDPLDQHLGIAVWQLEGLNDIRDRPDLIDFIGFRVIDGSVVLGGEEDPLVAFGARIPALERTIHVR